MTSTMSSVPLGQCMHARTHALIHNTHSHQRCTAQSHTLNGVKLHSKSNCAARRRWEQPYTSAAFTQSHTLNCIKLDANGAAQRRWEQPSVMSTAFIQSDRQITKDRPGPQPDKFVTNWARPGPRRQVPTGSV